MNQAENRVSGLRGKKEDSGQINKQHKKFTKIKKNKAKNSGKEHTGKVGDHDKNRTFELYIGIDEGEESQVSDIDQIFNMIMEKKLCQSKEKAHPYK